ncbi:MAG: CZB domain-containing protein [Rhodospirillaceae bacterium]
MLTNHEVDDAIVAHCIWGQRLRDAIDTGTFDLSPGDVIKDDACTFGHWLYGDSIPEAAKALPSYTEIITIHAQFHECAAGIVDLALRGKKHEALERMAITSDYATLSIMLTQCLRKWQKDVEEFSGPAFLTCP